jgi:hypothetical protein
MENLQKIGLALVGTAFLIIIMAWPIQLLWNSALVPAVDGVNPISFWQALGINLLATSLFKNNSVKVKND